MSEEVEYKRLYGFEFMLHWFCSLDVLIKLLEHAPKTRENHLNLWNAIKKQNSDNDHDRANDNELRSFKELSKLFYKDIPIKKSNWKDRDIATRLLCEIMSEIVDIPLDYINDEDELIWDNDDRIECLTFIIGIPQCYPWNMPEGLKCIEGLTQSEIDNRLMRIFDVLPAHILPVSISHRNRKKPIDGYIAYCL